MTLRFGAKLQEGKRDFRKMTDSEMFLGSTLFVLQTFLFKSKVSAECKVTYNYFLASENVYSVEVYFWSNT